MKEYFDTDWQNQWPGKGLLKGYREAWAEIYRLRARIAELEGKQ